MIWHDMIWYDMIWHDIIWYDNMTFFNFCLTEWYLYIIVRYAMTTNDKTRHTDNVSILECIACLYQDRMTPLHLAASAGSMLFFSDLLRAGAHIEGKDYTVSERKGTCIPVSFHACICAFFGVSCITIQIWS